MQQQVEDHTSMPPPDDDAPPIPNPPVGKQPVKRGPGFTAIEDILVAKSFIAASENPICGAHQKGKQFKESMLTLYNRFAKEQIEKDQAILDKCSSISREEYIKNGMGKHIPLDRSFDSIYYRFKSILAPDVMKFMGIMETTDMASGWNEDDHKTACLELYKKRQGKTFDHNCRTISRIFCVCEEGVSTRANIQKILCHRFRYPENPLKLLVVKHWL